MNTKKKPRQPSAHSCQTHRQTIISHCKHFLDAWMSTLNLPHNALCARWKSARGRQSARSRRGNCGGNLRVAPGQVTAAKAQDLLTRCLSHGCKNDSRSPHSAAASALSTEGNNLGAVSLHCVLLFPPESEEATLASGRKIMLSGDPPHPPPQTLNPTFPHQGAFIYAF